MSSLHSKHISATKYLESLPAYMFGKLEISLSYDPLKSSRFLLMKLVQRDSRTMQVIETQDIICRALDVGTDTWHRHLYTREMCSMLSSCITKDEPSFHLLKEPIAIMSRSWDILGVFIWTEDFKLGLDTQREETFFPDSEVITASDAELIFEALTQYGEKYKLSSECTDKPLNEMDFNRLLRVKRKVESMITGQLKLAAMP